MRLKIHPTALVDAGARLHEDVEIGAYCVIHSGVSVGEGTRIGNFVVLEEGTHLGCRNVLGHGVVVGAAPQDKKYKDEKTGVTVGDENIFREYVTIHRATGEGNATRVGSRNFFMVSSHVGHNCHIGDDVILTNLVGLGGHVEVHDGAIIGGIAGVHQFARIGSCSMVGGHSAVRKDVLPFSLVSGDPAKLYGINSIGLRRRGVPANVRKAIREAYALILHSARMEDALDALAQKDLKEIQELVHFIKGSQRGFTRRMANAPGENVSPAED